MEELKPLLEKAGLGEKEWPLYFKDNGWGDQGYGPYKGVIGVPSLSPWILVDKPSPAEGVFERNPYYWKVDTEGNQLPYIDRVTEVRVSNVQTLLMKILAGEVDLWGQRASALDIPFLKENEEKGGYRTILYDFHCWTFFIFNYTNPDPVWRKVIGDIRFRQALNYAVSREEIADSVYQGFAVPFTGPAPYGYDPGKANQLLDEMGMDERDAEGWRLGPDGKKFVLPLQIFEASTDWISMAEIVVDNWQTIGIKTELKVVSYELWAEWRMGNELYAAMLYMDKPVIDCNPAMWQSKLKAPYVGGRLHNLWYLTEGEEGEEPPPYIKKLYELGDKMRAAGSVKEVFELMAESDRLLYGSVLWIIPIQDLKSPLEISKKLGNVPSKGTSMEVLFSGEQFFFRQ